MASTFHFSTEVPPDSMFNDIQSLNTFNEEQFTQLVAVVISFLLEPNKSSKLLGQLDEFSDEQGVSRPALRNVVKSLLAVPYSAVRKNLSPSDLKEDFVNLGLSKEKAGYVSNEWKRNLVGLSRSAVGQTLMVNQLVDMEWKFGVTAASSELQQVGSTFIQMKLVVNKGNKTENVYMELSVPEFYSFLHEMEKAKASLEYFS
ncbi:COMM domain-containing protein 7-like [Lytechinus pictus]|uniref:COMM domain-containing protein 7-like n=1 Tax=Lytechinus pictus TaxID=7653 RepID=UPI0030BA2867